MSAVSNLVSELKRRNVLKVVAAYAVASFIVLQLCDILFPAIGIADEVIGYVLIGLIAFAPVIAIFTWMFELTPDGLKRSREVNRADSISQFTGQRINNIIILLLSVALVFFATEYFTQDPATEPQEETAAAETETSLREISIDEIVSSPARPIDTRPSIAVLPFVNMSSDEENEHFSDGLSEEILNLLAQSPELRVAGRTSSFFYKGKNENLTEIGEVLNVEHILEGSVRKSGAKVRITAQLISASDGFHLWSKTYDRELNDIFAVQDEIAGEVTRAMEVTLLSDGVMISDRSTTSPEAYDIYLRAKQALYDRGADNVQISANLFNQVIAMDPEYAPAYLDLAVAELLLNWNYRRRNVEEALAAAEAALKQVEALGHKDSDYYAVLGLWHSNASAVDPVHIPAADEAYETAIAMNPNNVRAYMWWSTHLSGSSVHEDADARALTLNEQARKLDPLNRIANGNHANYLAAVGRPNDAIELLRRLIRTDPQYGFYHAALTIHLNSSHRWDEGVESLEAMPHHMLQYPFLILNIFNVFDMQDQLMDALATIPADHVSIEYVQLIEVAETTTLAELQAESEVLLLKPDPDMFSSGIIFKLMELGEYDLVRQLIENGRPGFKDYLPPTDNPNGFDPRLVYLEAIYLLGQTERARNYAEELLQVNRHQHRIMAMGKGIADGYCYLVLGDTGKAIEELKLAAEEGWVGYYRDIATDPLWHSVIKRPEVQAIKAGVDRKLDNMRPAVLESLRRQGLISSI